MPNLNNRKLVPLKRINQTEVAVPRDSYRVGNILAQEGFSDYLSTS